ncbi:hypothetical protein ACFL08_03400 [Patescibacteria group bacterium]
MFELIKIAVDGIFGLIMLIIGIGVIGMLILAIWGSISAALSGTKIAIGGAVFACLLL